jgi:hypothetical protein
MKTRTLFFGATAITSLVLVALTLTPASAGGGSRVNGPDVTASRVGIDGTNNQDFAYLGTVGTVRSYSMASTACNAPWESNPVPDTTANWQPPTGQPVIGQALYRMPNDESRIEQIGLSWVKWSFCAVSETTCGSCQGTPCSTLGIGCADTYWATLNASTTYCGPRWEINPQGQGPGQHHDSSHVGPGSSYNAGMWVETADITAGGRFFAEIQYVNQDEQLARRYNNASWREVFFNGTTMTGAAGGQSSVHRGYSALHAWKDNNPNVQISYVEDDPGAGRFEIGYLVTDNGDGTWTYEYAVHNLNSHRAARGFDVPMPSGVSITNMQFHDIGYHNNDGYNGTTNFDGTDWAVTVGPSAVSWSTSDFATNPNANALRWQTTYNYRFKANTAPVAGNAMITMYRTGGQASVSVPTLVPDGIPAPVCPEDLTGPSGVPDGEVNVNDLFLLLAGFGTHGPGADLAPDVDIVDVNDLFVLLAAWGTCQ